MNKLPKFHSNKKCWRILTEIVFGKNCCCPLCGTHMKTNYRTRYLWCRNCRKKYSPTSYKGSFLYGMKLTFRQLFILLWSWQQKKSPDTARLLSGVSYTTVARWYGRFREKLPPDELEKLSVAVQIDESYFGKLKSKQAQTIVAGAISRAGKVRLRITNSRSQEVLEAFVEANVAQNSMVATDKWYGYDDLGLLGYIH